MFDVWPQYLADLSGSVPMVLAPKIFYKWSRAELLCVYIIYGENDDTKSHLTVTLGDDQWDMLFLAKSFEQIFL